MFISHNYYGEVKEDLLSFCESSCDAIDYEPQGDSETIDNFFNRLFEIRHQEKLRKIAEGRCISAEQFKSLVDRALELAERLGMDVHAEIKNSTGFISLASPHIDLHSQEEPELIEHLSKLISRADYQFFDTTEKYGETLIQFSFHYDLNTTSL